MDHDVWLYTQAVPITDIILSFGQRTAVFRGGDDKPAHHRHPPFRPVPHRPTVQPVIVAQSLYDDLVARYGKTHGERVYFEMETGMLGPFQPGKKYDATLRPVQHVYAAPSPRRVPVINNVPPARKT
jgi:hypothetical protein